jgi:DNA-binding MarR family transcriptional regulator
MKVSASTLTRNLKPLVDAGWLELAAGSDARSRSVAITPAGRVKREEARHCWKLAQDGLNQRLGVSRVLALHGLINESLELLTPDDASGAPESGADDE